MATQFVFVTVTLTPTPQTSPSRTAPAGTTGVEVDLSLDATNQAIYDNPANAGDAYHWTLEGSRDGGATWIALLGPESVPFGTRNLKTGTLPAIAYTDPALGTGGLLVRLTGSSDINLSVSLNGKWLINGQ